MRIVVDLTRLNGNYGYGVETFSEGLTFGLCKALPNTCIDIIVTKESVNWISRFLSGRVQNYRLLVCSPCLSPLFDRLLALIYRRLLPKVLHSKIQNLKWMRLRKMYKQAIVFVPSTYINVTFGLNSVVFLHDCQEKIFPSYFTKQTLRYRQICLEETLKRSSLVHFSSYFVKQEVSYFFASYLGKHIVVPEGVDTQRFFVKSKVQVDEFLNVLVPGSFSLHKGHENIVEAVIGLDKELPIKVFLTGKMNELGRKIENQVTLAGEKRIIFLGYVPPGNFEDYFRRADVVLSASQYESSSLPLLEGYCARCILVASSIPAHKEMTQTIPMTLFNIQNRQELPTILTDLCKRKMLGNLKYPSAETSILDIIDWEARARQTFEESVEILCTTSGRNK